MIAWIFAIAGWLLAVVFLILNIWNTSVAYQWEQERDEARGQRDRLNRQVSDLIGQLALLQEENTRLDSTCIQAQAQLQEADEQLQMSVKEIHGLREERKALQLQLQEATKPTEPPPAEVIEVIYEVKPPVEYAPTGKTPRKPRSSARISTAQPTGEDGTR